MSIGDYVRRCIWCGEVGCLEYMLEDADRCWIRCSSCGFRSGYEIGLPAVKREWDNILSIFDAYGDG